MQDSESVTVNIFGKEYTLRGAADAEYVQEVAAFVDRRMNEVARGTPVASTARVAILAAVNIADELLREQRRRLEDQATLEDKSERLTRLLVREMAVERSPETGGDTLPGA